MVVRPSSLEHLLYLSVGQIRSVRVRVRKNSDVAEKVQGPKSYFPSIEKKYGQPIDYWMAQLDSVKDKKHMEQANWLKSEFGMGHGHANAIVAVYRQDQGLDK